MFDENRKFAKDAVTEDTGPYHSITGKFEAEKYPNTPLLDTTVELEIPRFAITWEDRHKLMKELAEVIGKYQI
jgi:hypothetical protein